MYFASAVIRSGSVAFYFFPIYMDNTKLKQLAPTAAKCLKDKTCFHFKNTEQVVNAEIEALIT
jgi:hypothetical protein